MASALKEYVLLPSIISPAVTCAELALNESKTEEIEIENWKYNQEREMQKTLFSKDLCFCFLFCYFFNFWLISFSILAILKKLISFFHFFSF